MANINYRPLQIPGFGGINSGFAAGTNTIANGAALLTKALEGAQNQRINRYNMQKDFNTNEVLKAISGQTTLEGLAQAQKDGLFDTSRFGNAIDQAKIDAALRNQDNIIRKELTESQQFEDSQRDRNDQPILAQFNAAMRNAKSEAEVQQIAEQARQAGLSDIGFNSLVQTGTSNFRDNWRFNNDVTDRGEKDRSTALDVANGQFLSQVSNKLGDLNANELNGMVEQHIAKVGMRPSEADAFRKQANAMYRQGTELNIDAARSFERATAAEQARMAKLRRDNPVANPVQEFTADGGNETSLFYEELQKRSPESGLWSDDDSKEHLAGEYVKPEIQKQIASLEEELTAEARKLDPKAQSVTIPGAVLRAALARTPTIDRFNGVQAINADQFNTSLREVFGEYKRYLANQGHLDDQESQGLAVLSAMEQRLLEEQREHLRRGKK